MYAVSTCFVIIKTCSDSCVASFGACFGGGGATRGDDRLALTPRTGGRCWPGTCSCTWRKRRPVVGFERYALLRLLRAAALSLLGGGVGGGVGEAVGGVGARRIGGDGTISGRPGPRGPRAVDGVGAWDSSNPGGVRRRTGIGELPAGRRKLRAAEAFALASSALSARRFASRAKSVSAVA